MKAAPVCSACLAIGVLTSATTASAQTASSQSVGRATTFASSWFLSPAEMNAVAARPELEGSWDLGQATVKFKSPSGKTMVKTEGDLFRIAAVYPQVAALPLTLGLLWDREWRRTRDAWTPSTDDPSYPDASVDKSASVYTHWSPMLSYGVSNELTLALSYEDFNEALEDEDTPNYDLHYSRALLAARYTKEELTLDLGFSTKAESSEIRQPGDIQEYSYLAPAYFAKAQLDTTAKTSAGIGIEIHDYDRKANERAIFHDFKLETKDRIGVLLMGAVSPGEDMIAQAILRHVPAAKFERRRFFTYQSVEINGAYEAGVVEIGAQLQHNQGQGEWKSTSADTSDIDVHYSETRYSLWVASNFTTR